MAPEINRVRPAVLLDDVQTGTSFVHATYRNFITRLSCIIELTTKLLLLGCRHSCRPVSARHIWDMAASQGSTDALRLVKEAAQYSACLMRGFQRQMCPSHGVRLGRLVSLRAKVGSSRAALGKEAREDWLDEGTEDDLSATIFFLVSHSNEGQSVARRLTQSVGGPSTRLGRT